MCPIPYFHDYDGFLNNVAHPSGDQIKQNVHASLSSTLYLDCSLANGLDALANKINIDF